MSLNCSISEQFFNPRFLQVLLLRLAFSFALIPSNIRSTSVLIQRKCSVWKNGISWANQSSGEAIVEVQDQKEIVVLTHSKQKKLNPFIFDLLLFKWSFQQLMIFVIT